MKQTTPAEQPDAAPASPTQSKFPWKWLLGSLLIAALGVWLWLTPPGVWGKLWAIGYGVCHQIAARSLHFHDQQVPLCMRCTGMYLGAVFGLVFQLVQGKLGSYPPLKTILVMALFVLAFALDGVNSTIQIFPFTSGLYAASNTLRLITGMGMGLGISAAIVPAFHQTMWRRWEERSGLGSWKQLGLLLLIAVLITLAVLTESPWVFLPAALISTLGVYALLTLIYSMVWAMILNKQNAYTHYKQLLLPLLGGALTALLQIGLFDLGRYLLTGTWAGFEL